MRFRLVVDGDPHDVTVRTSKQGLEVRIDDAIYPVVADGRVATTVVRVGGRRYRIRLQGDRAFVDGTPHRYAIPEVALLEDRRSRPARAGEARAVEVYPPMPGRIVRIPVRPGDRVKKGDTLVVLEAMKMQNEVPAPLDGIVRAVNAAEGETVGGDRVVVVLDAR